MHYFNTASFFNRDLLKCFTTSELMNWSRIKELYESELRSTSSSVGVFDVGTDEGNKRWEDLRKRVVEHVSETTHICIFLAPL